jgi:non-heme chloroperoxidase
MKFLISESLKVPAQVWKAVGNNLLQVDYTNRIKHLDKPCLIIWGDKDSVCSKEDQIQLNNSIKESKLLIYENTGHALHWEDPEKFVNDLLTFINQLSV